jgi:hypothetical protein
MAQQPPVGQSLLIIEASRSHSDTPHTRWDSSGRVISLMQRPLPDTTQHSQETDINVPGGIRTHNLNKRTVADPRLRPRGHWDRPVIFTVYKELKTVSACCIIQPSGPRVSYPRCTAYGGCNTSVYNKVLVRETSRDRATWLGNLDVDGKMIK